MAPRASIMRFGLASTGGCREVAHAGRREARRAVRLHRRRRRHRRLRSRQPAHRGPPHARPAARGRAQRALSLGAHPGGIPLLHRQSAHRLDDEDGAGAGAERAQPGLSARQGAGRLHRGQRHDLHARPGGRLRPLAPARQPRLGLGRRPALLPEVGGPPRRRRPDARPRRRLEGHDAAAQLGDPGGGAGGGEGIRHPAPARLQRRRQRGLGLLRGEPAQGRALDHGARLPAPGDEAAQPARGAGGRDRAAHPRGPPRARRGNTATGARGGRPSPGPRSCSRQAPSTRPRSWSSRASARESGSPGSASRRSTRARASART